MPKNKNTNAQQKNESNKQTKPKEPAPAKSWAEVATLNIPNEVMQEKDPAKCEQHQTEPCS